MVDPATTAMEFGGYVEPPSHLTKKAGAVPSGLAAELRTIPDYDYSLFRYSTLALPFLLLIAATAALLFCLTCWQGPLGIRTPVNGIFDGVPYDYQISDDPIQGGIKNGLRNLRIANFVLGTVAFLIAVFAIMARPRPTFLRIWLIIAAIMFLVLWVSAAVAFGIGLAEVNRGYECERLRVNMFTGHNAGPANTNQEVTASPDPLDCEGRIQLTTANDVADILLSTISFLLAVAIIWSILTKNYAWGPGVVAIHKQVDTPKISFPPPSPFTHIHETRRLYVWFLLFVFVAVLITDFILTIMVHEMRTVITPVDDFNRRPVINTDLKEQLTLDQVLDPTVSPPFGRGVLFDSGTPQQPRLRGWAATNNRFRLALSSFIFGLAALQLMDLICWKRRFVAYVLAVLFFFALFTCFVQFAMDVHDVNKIRKQLKCPTSLRVILSYVEPGSLKPRPKDVPNVVGPVIATRVVKIRCSQWQYFATCFVEFFLAILLIIWIVYEFLYRCNLTWDTYYFYADSEWLRNHSLFVEVTDREAYDWQRFTMETGRDYYYSPTLGISTRTRPRNYIDPVVPVPVY